MGAEPFDHWPLHARQWRRIGPPLRPVADDVRIVAEHARARCEERGGMPDRVLLLGVTPELATIAWPRGTSLVAVDRCADMIATVWPRSGLPEGAEAVRGDWRELPIPAESVDLVIGDGCMSTLSYPREYSAVGREVRRVLSPGGDVALRFYVAPDEPEDLGALERAMRSGSIASFHCFKWRLAMCTQRAATEGARLADIWSAFRAVVPDPAALRVATGWDADTIGTIDAYRGSEARYTFPTLAELRAVLQEHFVEIAKHTPRYELGERCPTLILRRR